MSKNNFVKPNPYVFPFQEFGDLSNKDLKLSNKTKTIQFEDLKKLIKALRKDENLENKVLNGLDRKAQVTEKIFEFFMHPEVRFGDLQMYQENKMHWIKKFDDSLKRKRLILTILGFPFKTPVALKTTRKLPDLGEVMALTRLEILAQLLEQISGVPTIIYAITEGVLSSFVGNIVTTDVYPNTLKKFSEKLGYSHLRFIPLKKMELCIEDFETEFDKKVKKMQNLYQRKDKEIVKKVKAAYPSILRIVDPESQDLIILMDVYNYSIPTKKLKPETARIRKHIEDAAIIATVKYFAYLQMRDEIGFLDKEFGDTYITLTVSPKPNRLGIIPVRRNITILPHHGVPFVNPVNKSFSIAYRIDVLRDGNNYAKVILSGDSDSEPFYYERA